MDNKDRMRLAREAWGGTRSGYGGGSAVSTGRIGLTAEDVKAVQHMMNAHEEIHRESKRRLVKRLKLLVGALTEEEWSEVKEARDSGRPEKP